MHGYTAFPQGKNEFLNNIFYTTYEATLYTGKPVDGVRVTEKVVCIIYPAAALGVVLDIGNRKQKFYIGHTDDISSMTVLKVKSSDGSGEKVLVATGQLGRGVTAVWDPITCSTLGKV